MIVRFLIAILFCPLLAVGQAKHPGIIQGRVINKNGEPETGVKVKVMQHRGCYKTATTTDIYGMYQVKLDDGNYDIVVIYKSGVEDRNENVTISHGEKLDLDFSENRIKKPLEVIQPISDEDDQLSN